MSTEQTVRSGAGSASEMRSVAWLLRGATGSTEGVLELAGGRLAFTATGSYHGAPLMGSDERGGGQGRVFDAPLAEVTDVTFPWYYFGGGAKLTVGGERYRLSFLKPQNTQLTEFAAGSDIPSGRRTGKAWKQALAAR